MCHRAESSAQRVTRRSGGGGRARKDPSDASMAHGRLTKVSRPAKKATEATGRHLCHAGWFGFLSPAGVAWRRVARSASVRRHWLIRTLTRCLEVQESSLGMEQASRVKLCGAPAEIEKIVNNVRSSTAGRRGWSGRTNEKRPSHSAERVWQLDDSGGSDGG